MGEASTMAEVDSYDLTSEAVEVTVTDLPYSASMVPDYTGLPLYGYPGILFYIIHYAAVASLTTSNLASIGVLVYIFTCTPVEHGFSKRPIGERLVVYLAVCDLLFSIAHQMDHLYILIMEDHPPDQLCIAFAFFTQGIGVSQCIIIFYTAFGTMVLVVFEKKINLGKYDWKLLILTILLPVAVETTGAVVPFLGPMGMWCLLDARKSFAPLIDNIYSAVFFAAFIFNFLCYIAVVIKIRQSRRRLAMLGNQGSAQQQDFKTAMVVMALVAAYLFQYSSVLVHTIWIRFAQPHYMIYVIQVILVNLGGVYNALAYTVVRRVLLAKPKVPIEKQVSTVTTGTSLARGEDAPTV